MMNTIRLVTVLVLLALGSLAQAQSNLQSPEEFLGYAMGERFAPHHKILEYARYVASNSNRVEITEIGETYEGRPLVYLTISTPGNLAAKDEIRQNNLKLTGLVEGTPTSNQKAIVWLSYNVHGNEAVSSDASMWTLWELADPTNSSTAAWLENTVVIMDPCLNPDGRDRYVVWYHQMMGVEPNMNMDAREHSEPWPGGRPNHYYFDMNRDWAWQTQQETQARVAAYQTWMPHVHIDFHEMGIDSPYYFAPAAEPFHEYITPWQREFQTTIGMNNVKYFDQNGWLYFTREVFDLFAPSYGDTWPTMNGAIGITIEQGGSGRAGLSATKATGDTLTLADRIMHHHVVGLSTVEAASDHRENVIREFKAFFDKTTSNPPGKYKAYLIKGSNNRDDLKRFTSWLDVNYIKYGYAAGGGAVSGFSYKQGSDQRVNIESGDIVINTAQPKAMQISVLFEPFTTIVDSLTYDFTAWAVPYSRGFDAYALPAALTATGNASPAATAPVLAARPYAYVLPYQSIDDTRYLAKLIRNNVRVRFANRPFEIEGRSYDRGTLVINREDNEDLANFDTIVRQTATNFGRVLNTTSTGFATRGGDFGSDYGYIGMPKVLTVTGEGVASGGAGEIWYYFEQVLGYPITQVDADAIGRIDMSKYDVLVLASAISAFRGEAGMTKLMDWVSAGGKVVLLGGAASLVAGNKEFEDLTFKEAPKDEDENPQQGYSGRERRSMETGIAGSIYRVKLDNTHPLAYGYTDTYHSMKLSSSALNYVKDGWNVGVVPKGGYTAGFVGYKIKSNLEESANIIVYDRGRGSVVIMSDNPLYRGFWESGKLMMANAVFFVGND